MPFMLRRLSIPGVGCTVGAATEERAEPVREAVGILEAALRGQAEVGTSWASLLESRWPLGTLANGTDSSTMAAWGLIAMRLVGRLAGPLTRSSTLAEAETWFTGNHPSILSVAGLLGEVIDRRAVLALERVEHDENLRDLLPYVLDAHGPGSRASVMRNPETRGARAAKRAGGVFYTPADVAEYIAGQAIAEHGGDAAVLRYFDPACGSGVFLRAVLSLVAAQAGAALDKFSFAETCLFGVDIDPLAVQAVCFVLLCDVLDGASHQRMTPWVAWHRLRLNFVVADALTLNARTTPQTRAVLRCDTRESLAAGYLPPMASIPSEGFKTPLFWSGHRLADVLPEIADGADVVIGNPPYATIGHRQDATMVEQRFASFAGGDQGGKPDLFPLFLEMMWQMARSGKSAAGMVVPLSLAYHGGSQMRACRSAIGNSGGRWRFAFFDREPHALFGEDVKTRNAIAFRSEGESYPLRGHPAVIETGPLRKWTSRSRAQLFSSIEFTRLEDPVVVEGIPKLSGTEASHVFALLERRQDRLASSWMRAGACLPQDAGAPAGHRVFVASTAYNFLNVFRQHRRLPEVRVPWSENRLHCLEFVDAQSSLTVFAILSSRVIYWLWRTLEDGFHVHRGFLEAIPYSVAGLADSERQLLAEAGSELWNSLQAAQIVSVNGGRQSVAYRPHGCEGQRDRIDAVLLRAAGADPGFVRTLRDYVRSVVAVDGTDAKRRKLLDQFKGADETNDA